MKKSAHIVLLAVLLTAMTACTTDADTPDAKADQIVTTDSIPYPYRTDHFEFYFTRFDSTIFPSISDSLERHYAGITGRLSSGNVPTVKIHFYTTYQELADAVKDVVPDLPTWAIGLATSSAAIHMLSPKLPQFTLDNMRGVLVHEFAHCVTLHIRPNFGNNPRWLWESVAVYESGQFVDPHQLPYMVSNTPPTLAQMNSFNNTYVYEVGYLIGEYIVTEWGYSKLKQLIQSNGNLQSTLNLSTSQFQSGWFAFVKNRYGL